MAFSRQSTPVPAAPGIANRACAELIAREEMKTETVWRAKNRERREGKSVLQAYLIDPAP
jgi:hypothetical protein